MNTHIIDELDRKLLASANQYSGLGFASGAMGICLSLYRLGRSKTAPAYTSGGERLLSTIFEKIGSVQTIDLETGLSGIGLGIRQLIRERFATGRTDTVLGELDDEIFKQLSFSVYSDAIPSTELVGIAYYLLQRLEDQPPGTESEWLYRKLLIQTLNATVVKIRFDYSDAMFGFDTGYLLPKYLCLLSHIRRHGFYNVRTDKLIEEAGVAALGSWPAFHANRLFLLWGIQCIVPITDNDKWREHATLLRDHIDPDVILEKEVAERSIFIRNGAAGLALMLEATSSCFSQDVTKRFRQNLCHRIETSGIWEDMLSDQDYFLNHRGLYDGYCGVRQIYDVLRAKLQ